jgi:hypothetical protein
MNGTDAMCERLFGALPNQMIKKDKPLLAD